jgi:hypothetical protein
VRNIVDEMLIARVEERHMHILARRGTPLEDLPEATMMQKSDFIPALQRGMAVGGVTGTLAGLIGVAVAPGAAVIAGGVVLASALGGASLGAWVSSMVGISIGNSRVKQFEQAIEAGQLLMMIDVPRSRVEEITALVREHHPEVEVEGTEPDMPAFP